MVKKGDSSFNVVFNNSTYTNKLFARNINLTQNQAGALLTVDFTHYSKRKRNNLEDTDFDLLLKQQNMISHFLVTDKTVRKHIADVGIVKVELKLDEETLVAVSVSTYDKAGGLLK